MIIKQISVSDDLEERVPNAGTAFPFAAHYVDLDHWPSRAVPWHWHRELEFLLLLRGKMEVSTARRRYILSEGEGCFLNRGGLHRMEQVPGCASIYIDLLFDAEFLGGAPGSVFERKYLAPILVSRERELMPFQLHNTVHRQILAHIRAAYEAVDTEAEGYEILARNELSLAWLLMLRELPEPDRTRQISDAPAEQRVKKMMLFIQERYADKLSLEEIARAANISPRECLRDFQQCLHTTPFRYLIDHRLNAAAGKLTSTRQPVTDIAADCGFSTGSYFTKLFRDKFQMTPTEYRRKEGRK